MQFLQAKEEFNPPAEWREALSDDFLAGLGLRDPPPVEILDRLPPRQDGAHWGGVCPDLTTHDQVQILHPSVPLAWHRVIERIQCVYAHEAAHRVLDSYDGQQIGGHHGPVFLALVLLMAYRYRHRHRDESEKDHPVWQAIINDVSWYDWQDSFYYLPAGTPVGEPVTFAHRQAKKYAKTDLSIEAAAAEIVENYQRWRNHLRELPERKKKERREMLEKIECLQNQIDSLRSMRFLERFFVGAVVAVGLLLSMMYKLLF